MQWGGVLGHITSDCCQSFLPLWKALELLWSPRISLWVYILPKVFWGNLKEVNDLGKFSLYTESTQANLRKGECPHRLLLTWHDYSYLEF